MKKSKQQKRWVKVEDFYLHTSRDSKGVEKYLKKLKQDRRSRTEIVLLRGKEIEIFI